MIYPVSRKVKSYWRFSLWLFLALPLLALAQSDDTSSTAPSDTEFFDNPAAIYGKVARYEVFRNGKPIGEHELRFTRREGLLDVAIESKLAVRYLGVPVYRYRYVSRETWQDRQLVSVQSRIKDNLKDWQEINARASGRVLSITRRGRTRTAPLVRFPSNHWHPGVLAESRVFHTTHGKVHHVKIEDRGTEKLQVQGIDNDGQTRVAVLPVRRYRYSGGFIADVWYDAQRRWVNLQFQADDGSEIEYRCITCLPATR